MEVENGKPDIGEVFEEHGPRLLRVARRILRNDEDAADAVQEAMLLLIKSPYMLANLQAVGAWVYTVVRRRCVDIIRKARRRERAEEEATPAESVLHESPTMAAEKREVVEQTARAVKNLPSEIRFAFVENALHGKTFQRISEESGIPMGTLMARKQKAVAVLREVLSEI